MSNASSGPEQNEINLVDLWMVLVRRKYIVLSALIIAVVLSAVYSRSIVPVYESRAVIRVGQIYHIAAIDKVEVIEDPSVLMARLETQLGSLAPGKKYPQIAIELLTKKIANKAVDNTTMLAVSVRDRTAADAEHHLRALLDKILSEHAEIFNTAMDIKRQRSQSLTKRVEEIKTQITVLSRLVDSLRGGRPEQASILALEQSALLQNLPELESEAASLQLSLTKPRSQPSEYVALPVTSGKPIKTNARKIVALSIVFGLFAGVVGAFFVESLARVRRQMALSKQ